MRNIPKEMLLIAKECLFGPSKKTLQIAQLEANIAEIINALSTSFVDCDDCGCVMFREDAIPCTSEVRKDTDIVDGIRSSEPYVFTPHRCKRCHRERIHGTCVWEMELGVAYGEEVEKDDFGFDMERNSWGE